MADQPNEQEKIVQQTPTHQRHHHQVEEKQPRLNHEPRPRLLWTSRLHKSFIEAIDQLGGPNYATPKNIMRLMNVEGLTRQQIKSHLQNTRLGKIKKLERLAGNDLLRSQAAASFGGGAPSTLNESNYVEGNPLGDPTANIGCENDQGEWFQRMVQEVAAHWLDDQEEINDTAPLAGDPRIQELADEMAAEISASKEKQNAVSVYDDFWDLPEDDASLSREAKKLKTGYLSPDDDLPEFPWRKEWIWEGTIAKTGIPVCRARCFPVGKEMDMMLPEILDCTARTGLDKLAIRYCQAAGAWVVFFAPENDADMGIYNEFMHHLEKRQQAAVVKLDEGTNLFLVPPSEFSEKVLEVPGNSRISGVILRTFKHPATDAGPSLPHPHGDISYPQPSSSSGYFPGYSPVNFSFPGNLSVAASPASIPGSSHAAAIMAEPTNEYRHDYMMLNPPQQAVMPNYALQNIGFNAAAAGPSSSMPVPALQSEQQVVMPSHALQNIGFNAAATGPSSSMPVPALQSEQLAQLAQLFQSQNYGFQNNYQESSAFFSPFQLNQVQQQQGPNVPQSSGTQENNPEEFLQATGQFTGDLIKFQQIYQQRKWN